MPVELDRPGSVDHLYLDRDEPIAPWRPIMTGDVFVGVSVPACGEHPLALVLSHPCSLRGDGVRLVERVQALPVVERTEAIPLEAWKGNFRVMPLPELRNDARQYVARLTEFGMVESIELDLDQRIASLTDDGIALLQQRFFHNQSRVLVGLDAIHEQSAPVFAEVELWEQWNEKLGEPRIAQGHERSEVLEEEGYAFDAIMRTDLETNVPLREALKTARKRTRVRQAVLAAIDQRVNGPA